VTVISWDSSAPTRFPTFATRTGEPRYSRGYVERRDPFEFLYRAPPSPGLPASWRIDW
jgi:hypothetical protein